MGDIERTTGIHQVWIDAVVASREAAQRERDVALGELERLRSDHNEAVDHLRESRIARARGLAQAISECRDDARLDGIREGAAEIVTLLRGRQG